MSVPDKIEVSEEMLDRLYKGPDKPGGNFITWREVSKLIDTLRTARQELSSTQDDLAFEKSERRTTTATLRARIAELEWQLANAHAYTVTVAQNATKELEQQSQRDRERIAELEDALKYETCEDLTCAKCRHARAALAKEPSDVPL